MSALAILRELRAIGVQAATFELTSEGPDIKSVSFFPPEAKEPSGPIVPPSFSQNAPHEEDKCACGHMAGPAHDGQGLCLLGCPAESCARGPKP